MGFTNILQYLTLYIYLANANPMKISNLVQSENSHLSVADLLRPNRIVGGEKTEQGKVNKKK